MTVRVTDTVAITGQGSGLLTTAAGSGRGGDIVLRTRHMRITEGAEISAESFGQAEASAGNITITALETLLLREHSAITTAADQADGGNISLTAASMVQLRESQITTAVGRGEGRGGNITIDPAFVILQDSQITANAFGGPGGNITITAEVFLPDPFSRVTASSLSNVPGEITIQAPMTNLSGLVVPLPQTFGAAAALLRDHCAARLREGTVSSLVEGGRDGGPASPTDVLPSRLYRMPRDVTTSAKVGRYPPAPTGAARSGLHHDPSGQLHIGNWSASALSLHPPVWKCVGRR